MDAIMILIDSDAELARAPALADRLWTSDDPADIARLEAQAQLIAAYEARKWLRRPSHRRTDPAPNGSARPHACRHGADSGHIEQVSEVLRGRKEPSMGDIHIDVALLGRTRPAGRSRGCSGGKRLF
jgi:hypothetical protein